MVTNDFGRFVELNNKIARNKLTTRFFETFAPTRADTLLSESKMKIIFYDWLKNLNENKNQIISKTIYEKHLSGQKKVYILINYDKSILKHLFNETLLTCSPNERQMLLTKCKLPEQSSKDKTSFFHSLPDKLKAAGELISSETFLREGLIVISVGFLMGSIFYLLISTVALPVIAGIAELVGAYLPTVMQVGVAAYQVRWPILISRVIITRAFQEDSLFKRWVIVPVNVFLDCTLFVKTQLARRSCLYTYSVIKFANPRLKVIEELAVKKITGNPWVVFLTTQAKKRNAQAVKDVLREKLRKTYVDYKLGSELVQLRTEWISYYLQTNSAELFA